MRTHFLWLVVTLAAGGPLLPVLAEPALRVVDDAGHTVELAVPARRIVSLAPYLTELLFAAGAGDAHLPSYTHLQQAQPVALAHHLLAHVWARDPEHLRDLAMTAFTAREEVSHIETELIFEHVASDALPPFLGYSGPE